MAWRGLTAIDNIAGAQVAPVRNGPRGRLFVAAVVVAAMLAVSAPAPATAAPAPCGGQPQITDAKGDGHHLATDVLSAWFSEAGSHLQAVIKVDSGTWVPDHPPANGEWALLFDVGGLTRYVRVTGPEVGPRAVRLRHLDARRRLHDRRTDGRSFGRRGRGNGDDRRAESNRRSARSGVGEPIRAVVRRRRADRQSARGHDPRQHGVRRELSRRLVHWGCTLGDVRAAEGTQQAPRRREGCRQRQHRPGARRRVGRAVGEDPTLGDQTSHDEGGRHLRCLGPGERNHGAPRRRRGHRLADTPGRRVVESEDQGQAPPRRSGANSRDGASEAPWTRALAAHDLGLARCQDRRPQGPVHLPFQASPSRPLPGRVHSIEGPR